MALLGRLVGVLPCGGGFTGLVSARLHHRFTAPAANVAQIDQHGAGVGTGTGPDLESPPQKGSKLFQANSSQHAFDRSRVR